MPELFSEAADPNPDPVARLTRQITARNQELSIAQTVGDAAAAAEAEWRLNLLLDALADIYRMRAKQA